MGSSDNLMAPTNTLNLEDFVAKCNMDIFKLQEDCNIPKDRMKAMEEREKVMEKRQKKWGIPIILEQSRCASGG